MNFHLRDKVKFLAKKLDKDKYLKSFYKKKIGSFHSIGTIQQIIRNPDGKVRSYAVHFPKKILFIPYNDMDSFLKKISSGRNHPLTNIFK